MNNPTNLSYYSQILLFQSNKSRDEILFDGPDNLQRRTLHDLAGGFGLEYEYSRATKQVRITRPEDLDAAAPRRREQSIPTAPTGLNESVESGVNNEWQSTDFGATLFTDPATSHLWLEGENTFSQAPHLYINESFTPQQSMSTGPITSALESPFDTGFTSLDSTSRPGATARNSPSPVFHNVNAAESNTQDLEYDEPPRGRSRQATMSPTRPTPKSTTGRPDAGFGSSISITIPKASTLREELKLLRQKQKRSQQEEQSPSASHSITRRMSSFDHGHESPSVRGIQSPSSPASKTAPPSISDQVGILNSLPSSPVGRPYSSSPSSPSRRVSSPIGSPARSGPLDHHVQTKMRAVKAGGGACWRCRFLKKSVSIIIV
jgi:hypothetical protein